MENLKIKTSSLNNLYRPLLLSLLALLLMFSCTNEKFREVKTDNKKYGGILKINIVEDGPTTFFPPEALIGNAATIVEIGYETLLRYNDESTAIEGLLAKEWEINEIGDQYTLHLNENIYFHDNECFDNGNGRELTSEDVAYCLTQLCVKSETNRFSHLLTDQIIGGHDRFASKEFGDENTYLEGIEIIDDYTLKINLLKPSYSFVNILTHYATSIYPREAVIHYGKNINRHMVGTGPFKIKTDFPGKSVIFVRNNNYWKIDDEGNPLPYLDGVKITFIDNSKEIIESAENNMVDVIINPSKKLLNQLPILDTTRTKGHQLETIQSTSRDINYLSFLMTDSIFSNVKVREAFNLAIDRQLIVDSVFQGDCDIANYGIIPNQFTDYNTTDGYVFNPKKAKVLLTEAGYGNANKFPNLTIHITDSDIGIEVAHAIQKMLFTNLDIVVDISALDADSHYKKYDQSILPLAEARWEADYIDPDNFLSLFLSHLTPDNGGLNSALFNDPLYDSLFNSGTMEFDNMKRIQYFKDANKILFDKSVIIPLYHSKNYLVISSKIKFLTIINNAQIRLTHTYFEK